jgi:quercetin dioxygenase-like cupin family protein
MKLGKYSCTVEGKIISTNMPTLSNLCSRESILRLEAAMLAMPEADTSDGDVHHHFSEGLYARELRIPADTVLIGHIHLQGQINFLMKGTIRVTTDDGMKTLTAPQIVVTGPGTKRAGYAVTDVVWVTVSATEETDPEKIREQIIAKDFNDPRLIAIEEVLCPGAW